MIKNIYANGPFLQIEGTGTSYNTPYIPATMPSAGIVRYNNGHLEVYDGTTWHDIGGNGQAMVSMTGNAVSAIISTNPPKEKQSNNLLQLYLGQQQNKPHLIH